jgi:OmpA-OmpF porin, OOP family
MANIPDLPSLPPDPVPAGDGVLPGAPASPPAPSAQRDGVGLGRLLLGVLLLGVGASGGWLVGMLVAQVLPSGSSEPPATEVALRYGGHTLGKLRQLPHWWQSGDRPAASPAPVPALGPDDAAGVTDGTTTAAAALPTLTEADRDRLQADLADLQADLASLNARLQILEADLASPAVGGIEDRLQRLDQRLVAVDPASDGEGEVLDPETSAPETSAPAIATPYREPRFSLVSDRIVLPSALLFEPGSSILTVTGQQLLDSVVPDLRRAGPATLVVGSHTDSTLAADQATALTLQQSVAVQRHLASQLEDSGSRWVTVGYGQVRPLSGVKTETNRQRNQRVEIGIVPGR